MNPEFYVSIGALLLSVGGLVLSFRKGRSEVFNLDAKTYREYQAALKEAHDNYQEVCREMEAMKNDFEVKLQDLQKSYRKLELHNRALVAQLVRHQIVPVTMDEAYTNAKGE